MNPHIQKSAGFIHFCQGVQRKKPVFVKRDGLRQKRGFPPWTVIPKGYDKPIRLKNLGADYTNDRIVERIKENRDRWAEIEPFQRATYKPRQYRMQTRGQKLKKKEKSKKRLKPWKRKLLWKNPEACFCVSDSRAEQVAKRIVNVRFT